MTKTIIEPLLSLLARRDYVPVDAAELARQLHLPASLHADLNRALRDLEHSGRLARIKGNRYMQSREADLIPGRIRMNRQGKGFLQPDDQDLKEITIPESATGTALHEDRVLVRRDVRPRSLQPGGPEVATGTVVRILERRRTRIVGTLQRGRQFLFVIPDDPRIPHDIYVPAPRDVGREAQVGDKVVVEMAEWTSRHTNPEGEVVEVLGAPDAEGVDMLSVLRQYNLPLKFPQAVLQESRTKGTVVELSEIRGRVDCRRHLVVTIDPDDAKDFDDAICLDRAGEDQWRLWVHIADVSHYVRLGSALDVEARKRGNSTYLVDRVIPMLPEALSNELCSLKPGVDRLTKCVEFLLSRDGRVLETKFYAAVIHSQRRYSYQEAFAVLQRSPAGPIEHMLHDLHQLAQRIRRERFRAGSLELDFPEMKIRLDERGRVARIDRVENDVSHQLIEECMLLANEAVATRLMKLRRPAVYRVHEEPNEFRLREYREEVLTHQVQCGNLKQRVEVQRLLKRLSTIAIGPALKIGFLKSLLRARYAIEPLGHYGLAKASYTHFTSPIRRYADLVVHRALFDPQPAAEGALREIANHISMTERNSSDAERDSKDVKLFAYLESQLKSRRPECYPALVTDVRNFGFFVDVPGLAMSGLVPLSMVDDDFYQFDDTRAQLVGRRTRRVIRLGDRLEVEVAKVNRFKRQVDFRLAASPRAESRRPAPARRATSGSRPPVGGPPRRPESRPSDAPSRPTPGTRLPASRRSEAPSRSTPPSTERSRSASAPPMRLPSRPPARPAVHEPARRSEPRPGSAAGRTPPTTSRPSGTRASATRRPEPAARGEGTAPDRSRSTTPASSSRTAAPQASRTAAPTRTPAPLSRRVDDSREARPSSSVPTPPPTRTAAPAPAPAPASAPEPRPAHVPARRVEPNPRWDLGTGPSAPSDGGGGGRRGSERPRESRGRGRSSSDEMRGGRAEEGTPRTRSEGDSTPSPRSPRRGR